MTTYKESLTTAMSYIAKQDNAVFIGQQIAYKGNPMGTTLSGVDKSLMIETPVFEETQMGMSMGLALTGKQVVTFYPRWDFLLSATNQLVNHVDKCFLMTRKELNLIIRVGKGADTPLDPGHQHKGDYLEEFKSMCPNIKFHDLNRNSNPYAVYKQAEIEGGVHVIVEYPELYDLNIGD